MSEMELQAAWGQLSPFKCSTSLMDTLTLVGISSHSYTGGEIFHWCLYVHTTQICIENSKTYTIEDYAKKVNQPPFMHGSA